MFRRSERTSQQLPSLAVELAMNVRATMCRNLEELWLHLDPDFGAAVAVCLAVPVQPQIRSEPGDICW